MVSTAMQDNELANFDRACRRLSVGFRLKLKTSEMDEMVRLYFKAFADVPFEDVMEAGRIGLQQWRRFPTIAEWLQLVPGGASRQAADRDVRVMFADEANTYARAERLRYQDDPCACPECDRAGVTHRFLRFVPDFTDDGREEKAFHPGRQRIVVPGHWAHGEELRRWYEAKDTFVALFANAVGRGRRRRARVPLADREPGQEG